MVSRRTRILCCREIQSSIADSVLKLLALKIKDLGLSDHFEILVNAIRHKENGSEVAFRGLRHNLSEIKSFEDADICWVEEAADVTEESWDILIPTIRKPDSEIWVSFNTGLETDPTYVNFVLNQDEDMTVVKVGYLDNPLISPALLKEAEKMRKNNPEKYAHIWGGLPRTAKEGGVFTTAMLSVVRVIPPGVRWARGWDLAGTEMDPKKPDREPDWTAGVKMGIAPNGRYIVAASDRTRGKPDHVEAFILSKLKSDTIEVEHSIPQDPGQAGKAQVAYLAKKFSGYRVHFSPESGSKVIRAGPFASQVNAGNVDLLHGSWNDAYIRELENFPIEGNGLFDDQVDASSRAFFRLETPRGHARPRIRGL
jgi:predicted phage terminase large subunit-like protein